MSEAVPPLARLDIGSVISRTFGIIGRNLAAIAVVALTVALLAYVIEFGMEYSLARLFPGALSLQADQVLGAVIGFILRQITVGGITQIAIGDLTERRTGPGTALKAGLRLLLPLAGLSITFALGVSLATALLFIPGVIVLLRWSISTPARVVEGPGIGRALSHSAELTRGNRWRLLWLTLAFFAVSAALTLAFTYLAGVLAAEASRALRLAIVGGAGTIASAISTSISATGLAVCYIELRRMHDGSTFRDMASVFE